MHDPMTVAFEIRAPWKRHTRNKGKIVHSYRPSLVTIWHNDPEKDGSDDSCGRFMRARHGDKAVLARIIKRFDFDWDTTHELSPGRFSPCGWFFRDSGMPRLSVQGIVLEMFFTAASEVFDCNGRTDWRKARRFVQVNLADIMHFAENNTDSLHDGITQKYGDDGFALANDEKRAWMRKERIEHMAGCIYSWILRRQRPWYRHPRWHIHHWKIQIHFTQTLKRWLFSRCEKCGKRFRWGESPISGQWDGDGPRWFRGEKHIWHSDCNHRGPACVNAEAKP